MKASRFTDAQKAFGVKQGEDGVSVAEICRKAGYWRVHFLLQREGSDVNHKKVHRIYNELGLRS